MRFIVVRFVPEDGSPSKDAMVNLDVIKTVSPYYDSDGTNSAISFSGNPNATMYVADKFDDLRARLADLELPMPGVNK